MCAHIYYNTFMGVIGQLGKISAFCYHMHPRDQTHILVAKGTEPTKPYAGNLKKITTNYNKLANLKHHFLNILLQYSSDIILKIIFHNINQFVNFLGRFSGN